MSMSHVMLSPVGWIFVFVVAYVTLLGGFVILQYKWLCASIDIESRCLTPFLKNVPKDIHNVPTIVFSV